MRYRRSRVHIPLVYVDDFIERQEAAAKARKLELEKFRAKVADRALAKRLTARAARAAERSRIKTTARSKGRKRPNGRSRPNATVQLRPSASRPKAQNVNARRKPSKSRPEMPVTPPANRDRSAGKFAVSLRRWRRAREVALADLDAVPGQIETVGRLAHVQKVGLVDLARGGPAGPCLGRR